MSKNHSQSPNDTPKADLRDQLSSWRQKGAAVMVLGAAVGSVGLGSLDIGDKTFSERVGIACDTFVERELVEPQFRPGTSLAPPPHAAVCANIQDGIDRGSGILGTAAITLSIGMLIGAASANRSQF